MDYRVIWSDRAKVELIEIAEYIARDSTQNASAVVVKIQEVSRSLANFPHRGRKVPEFKVENIREVFVFSYRLIYEIHADFVAILMLAHSARLLSNKYLLPKN